MEMIKRTQLLFKRKKENRRRRREKKNKKRKKKNLLGKEESTRPMISASNLKSTVCTIIGIKKHSSEKTVGTE